GASAGGRDGTGPVLGVGAGETVGAAAADAPARPRAATATAVNAFSQRIRAMVPGAGFAPRLSRAGRGAVWLARLVWEQEAGGSNPTVPTDKHLLTSASSPQASRDLTSLTLLY